jgi:hypothetical protein
MARKTYELRITRDGTLTIIVGRAREPIGLVGKSKSEIYDAVKWALISKDAFISNERLTQDLYELIWSKVGHDE